MGSYRMPLTMGNFSRGSIYPHGQYEVPWNTSVNLCALRVQSTQIWSIHGFYLGNRNSVFGNVVRIWTLGPLGCTEGASIISQIMAPCFICSYVIIAGVTKGRPYISLILRAPSISTIPTWKPKVHE